MSYQRSSLILTSLVFLALASTALAASQHFKTIYSFKGGTDGSVPSTLVMDATGNLYGTTSSGGGHASSNCFDECGTVFELSPVSGGWKKKTLYRFTGNADGGVPDGGLLLDSSGNLFGVTFSGGIPGCNGNGCGVVFEVSRSGDVWEETVIYSFTGGRDGGNPTTPLVRDSTGRLIGFNSSGGDLLCRCGTIFELTPSGSSWIESTIYSIAAVTPMWIDPDDRIFTATTNGGNLKGSCKDLGGCGQLLEIEPIPGGWAASEIYAFPSSSTGWFPQGQIIEDPSGHLFGTTEAATNGYGTVYEMTYSYPPGWVRNVIHRFNYTKGAFPESGVVQDTAGALYGTTAGGGNPSCGNGTSGCGVVYKLTPTPVGGWSETVLHQFTGGADGSFPLQLIMDGAGNLYGPAITGGNTNCNGGCGTVFEVIP